MDNVGQSGSKNVALVRFIEDNVEYSCALSRIRHRNCLQQGDIRNVKWVDDVYYPAKVDKIRSDGQIDVTFIQDSIKYRTQLPFVAEADALKIGDMRFVKWTNGSYYKATILQLGEPLTSLCPNNIFGQDLEPKLNNNCSTINENAEHINKENKEDEPTTSNNIPSRNQNAQSYNAENLRAKKLSELKHSVENWKQKLCEVEKLNHSNIPANLQCGNVPTSDDPVTKRQDTLDGKNPLKLGNKKHIKKNWCMFCCQMQSKIGRHMAAKHKNNTEIQQYIVAPNSKIKKEIMQRIINKSNSKYNQQVIDKEIEGTIIPVKKSTTEMTSTTHVVCTSCGGLFSKVNLSSHKTTCEKRQKLLIEENPVEVPTFSLLYPTLDAKFEILTTKVLKYLSKDEISVTVVNDPLILEFGRRFLKGHMSDKQRNYVSSKLRTMGDLVCRMKKADPGRIRSLTDCLKVSNFDLLCNVVKQWSAYDDESGVCAVGSVPRRLCKSLKVCSQVEWSEAIKNKDLPTETYQVIRENHKMFMSLMNSDWALEVNCPGDKSLKTKKLESEDKMPLAEDIVLYFNKLTVKLERLTNSLNKQRSIDTYNNLCKTTLAYLIAFNCRRPSEVAYATIDNYLKRTVSSDKKNKLIVFIVSATKNDTKVPVIVPGKVQVAINELINSRKALHVVGNFLFSNVDGKPYNGSSILMQSKQGISLKKPEDFSANGLRHYWATVSQMDPKMKTHMPKFLGHTLATHQKFYEMPMADIHLNLIGPSMAEHYNIGDNSKSSNDCEPKETAFTKETSEKYLECLNTPQKRKNDYLEDASGSEESLSSPLKIQKRNRWTTPEKVELLTKLPKTLLGIEPAGKGKIRELWNTSKFIKKRHSLQMTRIEVSKYYTKKKKLPTPLKKQINFQE